MFKKITMCSLGVMLISCLGIGVMGSKYSKEMNELKSPDGKNTVEFRIAKLNQVWEKALRMQLPPVRQAELHSDLRIQEKEELQWKKLKAEGLDENGEKEAKLRRSFNGNGEGEGGGGACTKWEGSLSSQHWPVAPLPAQLILAKYGMDGKKDTRGLESNNLKDYEHKEGDMFDDPRLDKLWNKAKNSGKFSEEELQTLRREFQHHKDKIQEYNIVMDTVSRTEEIHKNVIAPLEGETKEHMLHEKHQELKEKMRNLNQGFERLRKLSREGFSEDSGEHSLQQPCPICFITVLRGRTRFLPLVLICSLTPVFPFPLEEFKEPRVVELWEMAQRANLSDDELDSLKEELKHFETKVEKHQHYQEQLELSHQKLKHVETLGDKEHILRTKEKYNSLAEKTREMGYKMKKHMQDLTSKISRSGLSHNEL
ncbi:hypothetical protein JZ751_016507 [Albula glossodonta]|uniref:Alpha-2-macroglobulin receptor-associated protein n=1 Tax=Albula glossodonta TaxID=121402 RepID=A0A8T2NQW5_9TELE|nr:hypothetical protein JZ751_016507 [Albula glossodonta]